MEFPESMLSVSQKRFNNGVNSSLSVVTLEVSRRSPAKTRLLNVCLIDDCCDDHPHNSHPSLLLIAVGPFSPCVMSPVTKSQ